MKRTWSDKDLIEAVKNSKTKAEVIRKLGLVAGGSYKIITDTINNLKLDTSHFLTRLEINFASRIQRPSLSLDQLLVENSPYSRNKHLKKLILKENILEYKCAVCGLDEWCGKEIVLQLDHISGVNTDNRIENLRLLCPNCHSQTDTFCGRKLKQDKINKCDICKVIISRQAKVCRNCRSNEQPTKINWPDMRLLIKLVSEFGFLETGRRLGVSDNAVRKHMKKYGFVA